MFHVLCGAVYVVELLFDCVCCRSVSVCFDFVMLYGVCLRFVFVRVRRLNVLV